uniref:Alpha-crystallin B chain n=1 Tax=Centruroides hentzi TaxID=88313 RepID=A0A2I9LNJ5_9SCOR
MAPERRLPILKTDFSVLDSEFSSIRERFDNEMRRMEDEMNRFRSQMLSREHEFFGMKSQKQEEATITQSSSVSGETTHRSEVRAWLDGMNSPLIQDSTSGKILKLRFDVSEYQPEEIMVKTVDNRLQVQAKHEEKTDSKSVYREYNREFLLPKGTDPEQIKSALSKDGVLTIEAPLPEPLELTKEHTIAIEKE